MIFSGRDNNEESMEAAGATGGGVGDGLRRSHVVTPMTSDSGTSMSSMLCNMSVGTINSRGERTAAKKSIPQTREIKQTRVWRCASINQSCKKSMPRRKFSTDAIVRQARQMRQVRQAGQARQSAELHPRRLRG